MGRVKLYGKCGTGAGLWLIKKSLDGLCLWVCICMCACARDYKRQKKGKTWGRELAHGELLKILCYLFVTDVAHNLGLSSTQAWTTLAISHLLEVQEFLLSWSVWLDLTTYIFYWSFVQTGPVTISVNTDSNRLPQSNFIESRGHVCQQTDLAGMGSLSHLLLASKTHTHLQTLLEYSKGTEPTKQTGSWQPAYVHNPLTDYLFL